MVHVRSLTAALFVSDNDSEWKRTCVFGDLALLALPHLSP
jgi:hypothetical protein